MTTGERRAVAVTVSLKAEEKDGYHLGLMCPDLGAKEYPIHVYRVPVDAADLIKKDGVYTVTLQRGSLNKTKDGQPKNPNFDTSYRWEWVGLGDQAGTPAPAVHHSTTPSAPAQAPRPQSTRTYGNMDEETTRRITFLSALNAAATYAVSDGSLVKDHVSALAAQWADAAFAYGRGEAVDGMDMFPDTETAPEARTATLDGGASVGHDPAPRQAAQGTSARSAGVYDGGRLHPEPDEEPYDHSGDAAPPAPPAPPAPVEPVWSDKLAEARKQLEDALRQGGCGKARVDGGVARFDFYITKATPMLLPAKAAQTVWLDAKQKGYLR